MAYEVPNLNAVNFELQEYTVPALNSVDFELDEATDPVVITLDADQITSSSVRLNGEITNDAGKTIDASFKYRVKNGETWTNQTDWQLDVGQATFNEVVENLDPVTTYEFKAVARYK